MARAAKYITDKLKAAQNAGKAEWLENYVKHDIKSLGVGIPEIREIVTEAVNKLGLSGKSIREQEQILNQLMEEVYTETKLAAIIYIQLFWQQISCKTKLELLSQWFDKGWISDWNVCDWLCVRIITPLIEKDPGVTVAELIKWNRSANLWKARSSLVPFAQASNIQDHKAEIRKLASELIKRNERFCKTAVGWVLREYSKVDAIFVLDFIDEHKTSFTAEVVRNAKKYLK
jgi:3-methyladenine DNA glycosylase AlkD